MTSGTVTSVTSPVTIPETIAGHISVPVPYSLLKWQIGGLRNIVSCWDNVSRISNDVKLFPHRPVIIVSLPRCCFCLVMQLSWEGVLRDETKTAARETSYESVRCFLSSLFCESLFLCIWCSRRGLKTVPGFRSLYFSAFIWKGIYRRVNSKECSNYYIIAIYVIKQCFSQKEKWICHLWITDLLTEAGRLWLWLQCCQTFFPWRIVTSKL